MPTLTWAERVRKFELVADADGQVGAQIYEIADRYLGDMADALEAILVRVGDRLARSGQVQDAARRGDYRTVAAAAEAEFDAVLSEVSKATGATLEQVNLEIAREAAGTITPRLDLIDPRAVAFARELAAAQVVNVNTTARANIRAIIGEGLSGARTRAQVQASIRSTVGLAPAQARMVARYDNVLARMGPTMSPDDWRGLRQEAAKLNASPLRDRRLAPLREGMTREQLQRHRDAYSRRALRYRAETIARTETVAAANGGRIAGIRGMQDAGMLRGATIEKIWVTAIDERTCDLCAPLDGEVVSIDSPFQGSEELIVEYPPLHPRCRCTISMQVSRGGAQVNTATEPLPDTPEPDPAPAAITPQQRTTATRQFEAARQQLRASAARNADDVERQLSQVLGEYDAPLRPPPDVRPQRLLFEGRTRLVDQRTGEPIPAEWEWWFDLPQRQRNRIRDMNALNRNGLIAPEEVAERIARDVPGVVPGEEMRWWVDQQMVRSEARLIARGRAPRGDVPLNRVVPDWDDDVIDLARIASGDLDDDLIRTFNNIDAERAAQEMIREARSLLPRVTHGDAPWDMDLETYWAELYDVAIARQRIRPTAVDEFGEVFAVADEPIVARYAELVPPQLDADDLINSAEGIRTLHAEIRELARDAGLL